MKSKFKEMASGLEGTSLRILEGFYESYCKAVPEKIANEQFAKFIHFCQNVPEGFEFEPYHSAIRSPVDYCQFGIDFMRQLVQEDSVLKGHTTLKKIESELSASENVILLGNHQIESDPQVIMILLEKQFPDLAKQIIFVAGERVTTDPLAIPFSMGCNLLCIYSKRYIDHPPEKKLEKQLHNKKTMEKMSSLFEEGGKCIYVAPSGGRDRKDENGEVQVSPFDPQSIEMFYLMAKKAKRKAHFYPLTLNTYNMLPPPEGIQKELGEIRIANKTKTRVSFGIEIEMETFPGHEQAVDKHNKRELRAQYIWDIVSREYKTPY